MKSKFYLSALALPLAFAACTQEDFVGENQPTVGNGTLKVNFQIEKNMDETRAVWNDGLGFSSVDDKFSLYWLGVGADIYSTSDQKTTETPVNYKEALKGYTNAVFYAQDEAATSFTSKSLVYEGKNIAVFPANLAHYSTQNIAISIDAPQNAGTVVEIPYISNVLDITTYGTDKQKPGYEHGVKMGIKQAANVFDITMNLANHKDLMGAPFNLTIDKVELIANTKAFTNSANVIAVNAKPTNIGEQTWTTGSGNDKKEHKVGSIVKQAEIHAEATNTTLTSTAITGSDGIYTVRFVVLPTDVASLTAASTVKVYTNCGVVTLKSTSAAYPTEDELKKEEYKGYKPGDVFTKKDGTKIAIAEMFEEIAKYAVNENDKNFKGEKVGKVIKRSIIVDMKNADLSSIDVKSSTDILHYVSLYTNIKKEGDMVLNLMQSGTVFSELTAEAVKAVNDLHNNNAQKQEPKASISLNAKDVNAINLTTAGDVYDVPRLTGKNVIYILKAGDWKMDDKKTLTSCSSIQNEGTLTINGTKTENQQNSFSIAIENIGKLKIGGNNWLNVANKLSGNGTVEIADNQVLNFITGSASSNITGTINVYGEMTTEVDNVQLSGTVNNYSLIGATTNGGFKNNGIVNVEESAIVTYIKDNTGKVGDKAAQIILTNRNDEVVTSSGKEGKIVYTWTDADNEEGFEKLPADKFTYVKVGQKNFEIVESAASVTLEFAGTSVLTSDAKEVANVIVNSGNVLTISSGNTLTAQTVTNNGTIYLGGKVYTKSGQFGGSGRLITVGTGSIEAIQP